MKKDKIALISLLFTVPVMMFNPMIIKNKQMPLIRETEGVEIDFKQEIDFRNVLTKQVVVDEEVEIENMVETEVVEEVVEGVEVAAEEIIDNKEYWKFEVSFYDNCYECTQNGNGQTASGEYTQEGVTIALPSDIPFGTQVYIEGLGWRTNQDTGGFIQYTTDDEGNTVMRIDVYVESHDRALELGRYYANGYIVY